MEIRTDVDTHGIASVEFNLGGTWHTLAVCPNVRAAEVIVDCIRNQINQEVEDQLDLIVERADE